MAVRRLKIKGDVYRTGLLETFPIEYMKLRYYNVSILLEIQYGLHNLHCSFITRKGEWKYCPKRKTFHIRTVHS